MGSKVVTISIPVLAGSLVTGLLLILPLIYRSLSLSGCSRAAMNLDSAKIEAYVASPIYSRPDPVSTSQEDIQWANAQFQLNQLGDPPKTVEEIRILRKGINPRTRVQQLEDLAKNRGVSHYEEPDKKIPALTCPLPFLVEEHHSNYGEPWAGGRDVFEFLAKAVDLKPRNKVLEVGCGTLRVGLHFIRYLDPGHFHCLEKDTLSLMAALGCELPSQGLLNKRPKIVRDDTFDFSKLGTEETYDLVYASAVFLHVPDDIVWVALKRLAIRLTPVNGRLFISHNLKFCTRLPQGECSRRLSQLGLKYIGKQTHDSLLFNHYEIWFEFRRV